MKARRIFLIGLGFVWSSASLFLACGGGGGSGGDGGPDGSTDSTTMFDVPTSDSHNDRTNPDSPVDGAVDTGDAGLVGHCSQVNGPACDMVLQNCPPKQECVVVSDTTAESGLGFTTACMPTTGTEHLGAGAACCPGASNPCDPGLTCIGSACAADAGGGRCAPACCPGDAGTSIQANCGFSPEGYSGTCSLQLTGGKSTPTDEAGILYTTCLYASTCTLFAKPCGKGFTCLVQGSSGTSDCVGINEPDGSTVGFPAGSVCTFANVCAQGLACITSAASESGASKCAYDCYLSGGTPPFDAGIITSAPGKGGCPAGQTCGPVTGYPSWLGACGP